MKTIKLAIFGLFLSMGLSPGAVYESWESVGQDSPFDGDGDLVWTGDVGDFEVTTATWPSSPNPDLAGSNSLRSGNGTGGVVSTILTDISDTITTLTDMTWSVFASGNSADFTTSKRVDVVLASSSSSASEVEAPSGAMSGYKLSLWDPVNSGTTGHGAAALGDSLSLWKATSGSANWELLGSFEFGTDANINQGWNFEVTRSASGEWTVSYSNGELGTAVGSSVITVTDGSIDLNSGSWYAGLGLLTTEGDLADFGFDNFQVTAVPEPHEYAMVAGLLLAGFVLMRKHRFRRE